MNLRRQLSLFFGGLILLVLSLLVAVNYTRFYETLEEALKEQFSLTPYLQLAEADRALLLERANALVDRTPVLNGVRRMNSLLDDPQQGLKAIQSIREGKGSPDDEILLNSTYEQMLQVLSRTEGAEGQDLVLLASEDGTVIAESFNRKLNDGTSSYDLQVSVESVGKLPFWTPLSQTDSSRGYLVYPNGKLYLYGATSFKSNYAYEGMAVVGMEIDRDFLRQVSRSERVSTDETTETLALVIFGDQVVASSNLAERLGKELVGANLEGDTWTSASGDSFLVKSTKLQSYYLTPEESASVEREGLTDQLAPNLAVGQLYLLRNVRTIKTAAQDGAKTSLLLGLVALAVALLAIPLVANRFTEPIGILSQAMKKVGQGELETLEAREMSSITEVKDAADSFNLMVIGLRQKKVLEHFVPEGTRKEIEALQGRTSSLGGHRWERTIMFSDLRGFTSMSESMTPDEVMAILNKYLHVMSRAIRLNHGDINEYIGDAILAVFESPDDAVRAALAMTEELVALRQDSSIRALAQLSQGIGLNTGPLVEGNIGEEGERLKRAVVGDTVNLAARIQDRSRDGSHTFIFLSQQTKDKLTLPIDLVHFGDEIFKGKAEPVPVWEIRSLQT